MFFTLIDNSGSLDFSKSGLKKILKTDDANAVVSLILDDNDIQKIENVESFKKIEMVC